MKKFIRYTTIFIGFFIFFVFADAAYAGNFAGVKITIEDTSGTKLNDVRVDLRGVSGATYTGGGVIRKCNSDATPVGPFVNLNGTNVYYAKLTGFKTGGEYTYGGQTYNNPDGVLYFGDGAGGGMGFGFACSCNPLKIDLHVPDGYFRDGNGDDIIDAGETGTVTITPGDLSNDFLSIYVFTLKRNKPPTAENIIHGGQTTNPYTFAVGTTSVQLLGKGHDGDNNQIKLRSQYRSKVTKPADSTYPSVWSEGSWGDWEADDAGRNLQNVPVSNGRTYQWQVRALDINQALSSWTGSWTFNIAAPATISAYTLSYNKNTTDTVGNLPSTTTHNSGSTATISSNTPTRTGSTFNGWNTNSSGTGTNYSSGGTISNITSDIILYAKWNSNISVYLSCGTSSQTTVDLNYSLVNTSAALYRGTDPSPSPKINIGPTLVQGSNQTYQDSALAANEDYYYALFSLANNSFLVNDLRCSTTAPPPPSPPPPPPLTCDFTANPSSGTLPLQVNFNAISSGGASYTYQWDFDYVSPTLDNNSSAKSPTYTYIVNKTYQVWLRVVDNNSRTCNISKDITVNPWSVGKQKEVAP